jgi:transposase
MDVVHQRCAGLDVHQKTVVACVRLVTGAGVTHEVRTFGTTTTELLALSDWLTACGVSHVGMESTGVFWKPVWHVLEEHVELVLANAMHIRNIPGRKSDVNDATWIADLLAHGLIRGSFVPPAPIQALRDLTRTRKQLVREVGRHTLRLQRVLEDANVKLATVVSDLLGVSGRAILEALIAGEADPERLADRATRQLRAPRAVLVQAVHGRVTAHHRFLLQLHLGQIDALRRAIHDLEGRMEEALRPFRAHVAQLRTVPGFHDTVIRVLLGEIGVDMSRFPTAGHLRSWGGFCPRLHESAGKRLSTRTRPGSPWLKTTLVQAAWAAVRRRDTYLYAQFVRLKSRRGPKKAILAVAASMLTAAYYILRDDVPYRDLGADYFVRRDKTKLARRLVRRLEDLGLQVEIRPAA